MSRSSRASRVAVLLTALSLGLTVASLDSGGAEAQLRDPPLGWDMWDPDWTQREIWEPDRIDRDLRWRMTRHRTFIQDGVPAAYRGARNPLTQASDGVVEGRVLYQESCASCHDPSGTGHGDAGLALSPSPALLAHLIRMPHAVDEYLIWAISEGGETFGTEMPAFKDVLTEEQIWGIITYMRAGFPEDDDRP